MPGYFQFLIDFEQIIKCIFLAWCMEQGNIYISWNKANNKLTPSLLLDYLPNIQHSFFFFQLLPEAAERKDIYN